MQEQFLRRVPGFPIAATGITDVHAEFHHQGVVFVALFDRVNERLEPVERHPKTRSHTDVPIGCIEECIGGTRVHPIVRHRHCQGVGVYFPHVRALGQFICWLVTHPTRPGQVLVAPVVDLQFIDCGGDLRGLLNGNVRSLFRTGGREADSTLHRGVLTLSRVHRPLHPRYRLDHLGAEHAAVPEHAAAFMVVAGAS